MTDLCAFSCRHNGLMISFVKAVKQRIHLMLCCQHFSLCTCRHLRSAALCSYVDLTDDLAGLQIGLTEDATVAYLINNRVAANKSAHANRCLKKIYIQGTDDD